MTVPDRLELIKLGSAVTGIDFIFVYPDQQTLDVFFLRDPATLDVPLVEDLQPDQVQIISPVSGRLTVKAPLVWSVVDGRAVLRATTVHPGDFSVYRLRIDDARIDRYFNDASFSFKANCPGDLDCQPEAPQCPPEETVDANVDYRARDFWSMRRALLDFASLRYPDWQDRLEADLGIMLTEVMSATSDEMAYYQDRIGREAYLETASQRRSLRRHAHLVDYTVHDGLGAGTWLDVKVLAGQAGLLPAGMDVWAETEAGEKVVYEVGHGMQDVLAAKGFPVNSACNVYQPHIWDEKDACLKVGAVELFVQGHHQTELAFDDAPLGQMPGKWLLLATNPPDPAMPARRWLVRVVQVEEMQDPLVNDPVSGNDVTRLQWEAAQALPFEMDLGFLEVHGNLIPATSGITSTVFFKIGQDPLAVELPGVLDALERTGADGKVDFLFSLPGSEELGLVWLGADPRQARPEIHLMQMEAQAGVWQPLRPWKWRRSLVGVNSSQPDDRDFTLDDGTWRRVVGYQRVGKEVVHRDYASDQGVTLRFGTGEFGFAPVRGNVFGVTFRLGGGSAANLAAEALTHFDGGGTGLVEGLVNPLAITGGLNPESVTDVRQLAPAAFQSVTYRAVRPEDYAEAAQRLPWVQRAGASLRWTGSWLSIFVTPDPLGAVTVSPAERHELENQLNRFRQAGREALMLDPVYADIDLQITLCVNSSAYAGQVEKAVLEVLLGKMDWRHRPQPGFFSPDRFTFGSPLERSRLEAAIQVVSGVRAVEDIRIRRRGFFDWRPFNQMVYEVGLDEVIRLENDPLHPERGLLRLKMEGGL